LPLTTKVATNDSNGDSPVICNLPYVLLPMRPCVKHTGITLMLEVAPQL
jgi:hypothetical protein